MLRKFYENYWILNKIFSISNHVHWNLSAVFHFWIPFKLIHRFKLAPEVPAQKIDERKYLEKWTFPLLLGINYIDYGTEETTKENTMGSAESERLLIQDINSFWVKIQNFFLQVWKFQAIGKFSIRFMIAWENSSIKELGEK